ncbi:hypothetical protein V8C86DRAFT_3115096 [Haematococcus lacustris]
MIRARHADPGVDASGDQPARASGPSTGSQDLLEEILAGMQPATRQDVAGGMQAAAAWDPAQQLPEQPADGDDEQVLQAVLAYAAEGMHTPRPRSASRSQPASTTTSSGQGLAAQQPSGLHRSRKRPTSARRLVSGPKRQALMDLLDQVELMMKAREDEVQGGLSPPSGTGSRAVLHLSDMWQDLPVQPERQSECDPTQGIRACEQGVRQLVCSASEGLCVLHQDILLSEPWKHPQSLAVGDVWWGGTNNDKAVLGTLRHELVQWALLAQQCRAQCASPQGPQCVHQCWAPASVAAASFVASWLLHGACGRIPSQGADDKVTGPVAWLAKYVGAGHAGPRDLVMGPNHQGPATQVLVEEVVDIEESIWAPQYGLKGQLDATLRVSCSSMGPPQRSGAGSRSWQGQTAPPVAAPEQGPGTAWSRDSLVPFEYGEATAAPGSSSSAAAAPGPAAAGAGHSGDLGLLWNSGDSANMHAVKRAQHELAALMMHRNRLAAHLVGKQRLPPTMLRNERQCGTCFAATYCALVHKALEGGDEASSGMRPQQWSGLTSHLGPSHGQFLRHWLGLVELEDSAAREGRSALWAVPGRQRELQGSCLADLQLQHSQPSSYGAPTAPPMSLTPSSFLAASAFAVGDMALLGMEGRHVNVARVVVHAATQDTLVLAAKKEIRMMEPYLRQPQSEGLPPLPTQQGTAQPPCAANRAVLPSAAAVLWRLDKDEAAAGVTQQRTNLLMLMEAASGQVARLRELVVDLAPPRMVAEQVRRQEGDGGSLAALAPAGVDVVCLLGASGLVLVLVNHLNSEQQAAVQAVLQMQDYTLILGMPGTGGCSSREQPDCAGLPGLVKEEKDSSRI